LANARVGTRVRDPYCRQRTAFCGVGVLVAAAGFHCHCLSVRRPSQLVRGSLFSDASAGAFWAFAQLLSRRLQRHRPPDIRLRIAAGTVLLKRLVGRELAQRNRHMEHADDLLDWRAGPDAWPAESKS